MAKTAKQKAWEWCSRYCRLRDALNYCRINDIDIRQFAKVEDIVGKCCTCDDVRPWIEMDAGHYFDRGGGGTSGVYFDERNINLQSKSCNAGFYKGTRRPDIKANYDKFMLDKYGQGVIDELLFLHNNQSYKYKIIGIGLMYKEMYEKLKGK